jgi:hypothetical protein
MPTLLIALLKCEITKKVDALGKASVAFTFLHLACFFSQYLPAIIFAE